MTNDSFSCGPEVATGKDGGTNMSLFADRVPYIHWSISIFPLLEWAIWKDLGTWVTVRRGPGTWYLLDCCILLWFTKSSLRFKDGPGVTERTTRGNKVARLGLGEAFFGCPWETWRSWQKESNIFSRQRRNVSWNSFLLVIPLAPSLPMCHHHNCNHKHTAYQHRINNINNLQNNEQHGLWMYLWITHIITLWV